MKFFKLFLYANEIMLIIMTNEVEGLEENIKKFIIGKGIVYCM